MTVYLRYVLARPTRPKPPLILKDETVSHKKKQDTTAVLYAKACDEAGHPTDPDTMAHLESRDRTAWLHTHTFPIIEEDMHQAATEFGSIARRMRQEKEVPDRNPFACQMPKCDWLELCHANPAGDIENWWGIESSDYSGLKPYTIRYQGRFDRELRRDKPGVVVTSSEIRNYLSCPRRWYFENVRNASRGERTYSRYSSRWKGTMVHCYAELLAKADAEEIRHTDIGPAYDLCVDGFIAKLSEQSEKEQLLQDAETCIEVAVMMYLAARKPTHDNSFGQLEILHTEQRFAAVLPGTKTWITCQPDLVCRDQLGNLIIIDYKTTNRTDLEEAAEGFRYNPSMYLYALAVSKGYLAKEAK